MDGCGGYACLHACTIGACLNRPPYTRLGQRPTRLTLLRRESVCPMCRTEQRPWEEPTTTQRLCIERRGRAASSLVPDMLDMSTRIVDHVSQSIPNGEVHPRLRIAQWGNPFVIVLIACLPTVLYRFVVVADSGPTRFLASSGESIKVQNSQRPPPSDRLSSPCSDEREYVAR